MKASDVRAGMRVRVNIPDPASWAVGAADALNGREGTVEHARDRARGMLVLVRFDEPAPTWWPAQTPPRDWHFGPEELEPLTEAGPACGCREGVMLGMKGLKVTNPDGVQRCDECGLFASDEEALGFAIGKGWIVAEDAP